MKGMCKLQLCTYCYLFFDVFFCPLVISVYCFEVNIPNAKGSHTKSVDCMKKMPISHMLLLYFSSLQCDCYSKHFLHKQF